MPLDDVVLNKFETINRCIVRVNEEYQGCEDIFASNFTKQDSVILNLERATQACIDVATHIVRVHNLGIPKKTREVFEFLENSGYITAKTGEQMKKMVGFRNIAVHDYKNLSIEIVEKIIKDHLEDFCGFMDELKRALGNV